MKRSPKYHWKGHILQSISTYLCHFSSLLICIDINQDIWISFISSIWKKVGNNSLNFNVRGFFYFFILYQHTTHENIMLFICKLCMTIYWAMFSYYVAFCSPDLWSFGCHFRSIYTGFCNCALCFHICQNRRFRNQVEKHSFFCIFSMLLSSSTKWCQILRILYGFQSEKYENFYETVVR